MQGCEATGALIHCRESTLPGFRQHSGCWLVQATIWANQGNHNICLGLSDIKYFMSRAVSKMGLNPGGMEQPRAQSWLCAHQVPNCQLCPHASMDLISHQRAGRTSVSRRWTLLFSSTHGASSGHRGKLHQGMHTQSGTSIWALYQMSSTCANTEPSQDSTADTCGAPGWGKDSVFSVFFCIFLSNLEDIIPELPIAT